MRSYITALIVIFFGLKSLASPADSLWLQYGKEPDKGARTRLLWQIASGSGYSPAQKDSINEIAINEAKSAGDNGLLIQAYRAYFRNIEISEPEKAIAYASQMLSLAQSNNNNEWFYEAYSAIAKIKLSSLQPVAALDHAGKAYYHVSLLTDDTLKAECMMLYGSCQEQNNQKIEAFRNYVNALYLAEKQNNSSVISDAYSHLSSFYQLVGSYDKAKEYKQKQINLLLRNKPVDSLALMNLNNDLACIFFDKNERREGENLVNVILGYTYRHNATDLTTVVLRVYISYLIEKNQFSDLANVYTKQYPDELVKLSQADTTFYFRIMSYIAEANGNMDSALHYYQKAEAGTINEGYQGAFLANFYKRYAQFLLRKNDVPAAIAKMEQAFEYAKQSQYLPYLVEISNYLDSLNYKEGNLEKAYAYNKLNKGYEEQQNEVNKGDEILRLEIDNENKQLALNKDREEQAIRRKHHLQYMAISLLLAFSLVLLVALGAMKVHKLLIKSVGFFSFIFLFEFIILLADNWIHHATHGEPWKVLSIKIVLIAVIFPLHHWLEEKVIHYLTTHNFINTTAFKMRILSRGKKIVLKDEVAEIKNEEQEKL